MTHEQQSVPAGWYPDPDGQAAQRWWDGSQWTNDRQGGAADARGQHPLLGGEPTVPAGTPVYTVWIWLVVLLPLVSLALFFTNDLGAFMRDAMADAARPGMGSMAMMTSPGYLVLSALSWVVYGVSVLCAYLDRRSLLEDGYPRTFHWAWAFLSSIVYVIGRSVLVKRAAGRGTAPMWVSIILTVVTFILVFGSIAAIITEVVQQSMTRY